MAECNNNQGHHNRNSESTFTEKCNRMELNCLQCCDFDGQEVQIDATNVDVINVDLISNETVLLGDNSTVKICQQCFRRQNSTQQLENKSKGSMDGSGVFGPKKRRRKRRKRSSQDPSTSRKCVGDGNSADSENSDGDETSAFQDFLHNDSDDD